MCDGLCPSVGEGEGNIAWRLWNVLRGDIALRPLKMAVEAEDWRCRKGREGKFRGKGDKEGDTTWTINFFVSP